MTTEVVLRPSGRPNRYAASLDGQVIVASSPDPEHDAARALIARGITGEMVTRWAGSAHAATRPRDIAATAQWAISAGGRPHRVQFQAAGTRQDGRSDPRLGGYRPHLESAVGGEAGT